MASSIDASTAGSGGVITTADNTGILNLKTAGTNAVTIDASQNVGIGTTSPTNFGSNFKMLAVQGTDYGVIQGISNSSSTTIEMMAAGSIGYLGTRTNHPLALRTNDTERMRINSSGNVGIGITTQDTRLVVSANIGTAVQRIYNLVGTNTYQMSFHNSTQECGTITTGNNTVGYNSNSDYRLKDNVIPMTGALDKIAKLKPVTYTWKASGTNGQGFIAHELQEHFPDAVSGEKDAVNEDGKPVYQGVDTSFLVATLTAAIQEQQTLIVSQSELINSLTARVTALEAK